jgi:hypothetical protein
MIKPTVGRVVLYYPTLEERIARNGDQPLAAIICCVLSDTCVNLVVFDANGISHSRTSVILRQDDQPNGGYCWEWMPYQKGQAAKTEELENELKDKGE